jgi:hypothetical protein
MSAQKHVVEVPRWPRLAAWVADDGSVRLDVGGVVEERGGAAELGEARGLVRELLRAEAAQLGRPARAWITDPQGSWPVIVDPRGKFEEDLDPGPRPVSGVCVADDAAAGEELLAPALLDEEELLLLEEPFVEVSDAVTRARPRRARRGACRAATLLAGTAACGVLAFAAIAREAGPSPRVSEVQPAVAGLLRSRAVAVAGERLRHRAVPPRRRESAPKRSRVVPARAVRPAPPAVARAPRPASVPVAVAASVPARPAARASVACQEFGGC